MVCSNNKKREAGVTVAQLCRDNRVSQATFYKWKAKFGGMSVSETKRLKQFEDENSKLKKFLAESVMDNAALKDLLPKSW